MSERLILTARTGPEILAGIVDELNRGNLEIGDPPAEAELCGWLEDAPEAARKESCRRLDRLYGGSFCSWGCVQMQENDYRLAARGFLPVEDEPGSDEFHILGTLAKVHKDWLAADADTRPKHPLAPLVEAWARRPVDVSKVERPAGRRILPVIGKVALMPERARGLTFANPAYRPPNPLPLFPPPERHSVPLLDVCDSSGVPTMARGRGAPLALRLMVRAMLAVSVQDRRKEYVRLAVSVRDLRDWFWPNGWNAGRHWPRMLSTLEETHRYTIRLPDGSGWRPVLMRQLPAGYFDGRPDLDGEIVLELAFPPGVSDGPPIDLDVLDQLGVKSAPGYRAMIAGHSLTWKPGRTRRPHSKSGRFGWSASPDDYPIVTADDRRRLAFGDKDGKHRTRTEVDAPWDGIPGLTVWQKDAVDRDAATNGWRLIPDKAVEIMRERRDLPNRGK